MLKSDLLKNLEDEVDREGGEEELAIRIRKGFIARYVYTYEEFVLVTEASTVQTEWQWKDKTRILKIG